MLQQRWILPPNSCIGCEVLRSRSSARVTPPVWISCRPFLSYTRDRPGDKSPPVRHPPCLSCHRSPGSGPIAFGVCIASGGLQGHMDHTLRISSCSGLMPSTVVGLTGGIACGKSTVSELLATLVAAPSPDQSRGRSRRGLQPSPHPRSNVGPQRNSLHRFEVPEGRGPQARQSFFCLLRDRP